MARSYTHDPDDVLDYYVNWTTHLTGGEAIDTSTWSEDPVGSVTLDNDAIVGAITVIWAAALTLGVPAVVTNEIVTDSTPPRTMHQSIVLIPRKL